MKWSGVEVLVLIGHLNLNIVTALFANSLNYLRSSIHTTSVIFLSRQIKSFWNMLKNSLVHSSLSLYKYFPFGFVHWYFWSFLINFVSNNLQQIYINSECVNISENVLRQETIIIFMVADLVQKSNKFIFSFLNRIRQKVIQKVTLLCVFCNQNVKRKKQWLLWLSVCTSIYQSSIGAQLL